VPVHITCLPRSACMHAEELMMMRRWRIDDLVLNKKTGLTNNTKTNSPYI
jgi:hypothetical protein